MSLIFRYDRWNCSYKKSLFNNEYRETAILHGITSSAIMYSVARACAEGKLYNCHCPNEKDPSPRHNWKWGGCGDNIQQARKITTKFLQINKKGDDYHNIINYNYLVGMKVVANSEMKMCTCHGLSCKKLYFVNMRIHKFSEKERNILYNFTYIQNGMEVNSAPSFEFYGLWGTFPRTIWSIQSPFWMFTVETALCNPSSISFRPFSRGIRSMANIFIFLHSLYELQKW